VSSETVTVRTDKRGRERTTAIREVAKVRFEGRLPMRESSGWLYRNESGIVHAQEDFSFPLRFFVPRFPVECMYARSTGL
jgi:hypothetical protein